MLFLGETRLPEGRLTPDTRSFGEAFSDYMGAAYELQRLRDNAGAADEALAAAYSRRIAEVEQATGVKLGHPYQFVTEGFYSDDPYLTMRPDWPEKVKQGEREFQRRLAELAVEHPDKRDLIRADMPVQYDAFRDTQEAQAAAEREQLRTGLGGFSQVLAGFLGAGGAWLRDPVNQTSLALGAGPSTARTVGGRILQRALTEGAINGGVELAVQQGAERYREQAGVPIGWEGIWQQVGLAASFGGGLGGLFQGGAEVFKALGKASPEVTQAFERVARGEGSADDLKAVAEAVNVEVPEADLKAFTRALEDDAATAAVVATEAVEPRQLAPVVKAIEDGGPVPQARGEPPGLRPENFQFFDATQLAVDPARFQFKAGGDAEGVTSALKGITEWRPERAGQILVWEDEAGRLFVADGHQRTGLARRISQATGQQISIPGYVFRAADGYTAEDLRIMAALKNIGEGSGTSIDAAKVLRDGGGDLAGTGLPPNGAIVRDALGLSRLSDDAFTMVVNEIVDARFGALVGRLADEPKLHAQMLGVLKEQDPRSIVEAESMIKDMLDEPTFTGSQASLFGEEDFARMLLKEKAQVRAASLRALKKDRAVFNRLVEEQSRIAEAGNVLDTGANAQRAQQDAVIIEAIDRLSRQVGPVSAALNDAARAVAGGARAGDAARGFTEAVRAEIDKAGGNLGRIDPGGQGQPLLDPAIAGTKATEPGTPEAAIAAEDTLRAAGGDVEPTAADLEAAGQANMFGEAAPVEAPLVDARAQTRALIARQPERTFDELYSGALEAAQAQLSQAGDEIAAATGARFKNPGLKKRPTAEAKMGRKGYLSTRQLTDLVRGGFVVDTPEQAEAIAAELGRRFSIVDEGWYITPVNYTDRKLLVQFGDGTIGEVQIWERAMLAAKSEKGHKLYEQARMLPGDDPRVAQLNAEQAAVYDAVLAGLSDDWRAALGISGRPGNNASNVAGDTLRPLSDTSAPLTSSQPRPGPSTAQAPAAESTAGRSSQSTNVRGVAITSQDSADRAKLQTEAGADGLQQILIPGVAEITVKDLVNAQAAKPMQGGAAAPPAGGLFDMEARAQIDLLDAIPAGVDTEGKPVVTTHAELRNEAARVDYLADVVASCRE